MTLGRVGVSLADPEYVVFDIPSYVFETNSEDMVLSGSLKKTGYGALTLTGHNTFSANVMLSQGVLQADFGQGLDPSHGVDMFGGVLASVTGSITAELGSGAGQINCRNGTTLYVPRFTALDDPLTVNLGGAGASLTLDHDVCHSTLGLNVSSYAMNDITLINPIVVSRSDNEIQVAKQSAILKGSVIRSGDGWLIKKGEGRLILQGENNEAYCLWANEGTTVLDNATRHAFNFIRVFGGATLAATNQVMAMANNINVRDGYLVLKECAVTNKEHLNIGCASTNYNWKAKKVTIDGGTYYCTGAFYAGQNADMRGDLEILNGAEVNVNRFEIRGGRVTLKDGTITARNNADSGLIIGNGTPDNKNVFIMEGGEFQNAGRSKVGVGGGNGYYLHTGGTNTAAVVWYIGFTGGTGDVVVSGGKVTQNFNNGPFRVGREGRGYLGVRGTGLVDVSKAQVDLAELAAGVGRIELGDGGTLLTKTVRKGAGSVAELFFDGGTLMAAENNTSFVQNGLTAFGMSEQGGIVDSNGRDVTLAKALGQKSAFEQRVRGLAHRWCFNGNLTDSVGGCDATMAGEAGGCTYDPLNTQIVLDGGYIDLGTNILPNNGLPVTIELWATQRQIVEWSAICQFGDKRGDWVDLRWTRGTLADSDLVRIFNDTYVSRGGLKGYALNTEFHIALVLEPNDDGTWQATAYKQDVFSGATLASTSFKVEGDWTIEKLTQTYCTLGYDLNPAEHNGPARANYNEVRIWHRALSEAELTENALAGPDALPGEAGAFVKRGEGTLTLTGVNTYTNATHVEAGTLALAAEASLPAATKVEVAADAFLDLRGTTQTIAGLSGAGTVSDGTLTVNGEINPGTDPAALTLSGVSLGGGTITLDATAEGVDTLVNESGTMDLSKMALEVRNLSVLPKGGYVIVASPGGVSGRFTSVTLSEKTWTIGYSPDGVHLAPSGLMIMIR